MGTFDDRIRIKSWDEVPYRELEDGQRFTKADVVLESNADSVGDRITRATFESVMYYRPDGYCAFVAIMHVTADLAGRAGSFTLSGVGTYSNGNARMNLDIISGSGTGDLESITGSLKSSSTGDDYPHMPVTLQYSLS